ncbi:unnamed protein product [Ectocarpus sp. 8 AP-2014]
MPVTSKLERHGIWWYLESLQKYCLNLKHKHINKTSVKARQQRGSSVLGFTASRSEMQQEKRDITTPFHGKPSVGTRLCTCCARVDREAAWQHEEKSNRGETTIATTPSRPPK